MSRPSIGKTAAYWGATGLVALFMLSGGVAHVLQVQASVDGFVALGYPLHFVTLLGIWKLLGALAILAPKLPRLKEWAYAGIVFDLTGAAFAWASVGDAAGSTGSHIVAPLVLLGLAGVSWALRPDSRKLQR